MKFINPHTMNSNLSALDRIGNSAVESREKEKKEAERQLLTQFGLDIMQLGDSAQSEDEIKSGFSTIINNYKGRGLTPEAMQVGLNLATKFKQDIVNRQDQEHKTWKQQIEKDDILRGRSDRNILDQISGNKPIAHGGDAYEVPGDKQSMLDMLSYTGKKQHKADQQADESFALDKRRTESIINKNNRDAKGGMKQTPTNLKYMEEQAEQELQSKLSAMGADYDPDQKVAYIPTDKLGNPVSDNLLTAIDQSGFSFTSGDPEKAKNKHSDYMTPVHLGRFSPKTGSGQYEKPGDKSQNTDDNRPSLDKIFSGVGSGSKGKSSTSTKKTLKDFKRDEKKYKKNLSAYELLRQAEEANNVKESPLNMYDIHPDILKMVNPVK